MYTVIKNNNGSLELKETMIKANNGGFNLLEPRKDEKRIICRWFFCEEIYCDECPLDDLDDEFIGIPITAEYATETFNSELSK